MSTLPPEIISYIIELSVTPPNFDNDVCAQRSSELQNVGSVCKAWLEEAKRQYYWYSVLHLKKEDEFNIPKLIGLLNRLDREGSVKHLRVMGWACDESFKLSTFERDSPGIKLADSLRKLSLAAVVFDPNILYTLPSLEMLSVVGVIFKPASPSQIKTLNKLEELFLHNPNNMPSCLLPPHLPALRRLALKSFTRLRSDKLQDEWSFEQLISLRGQLHFLVCDMQDFKCWEAELSLICEFTLFLQVVPHDDDWWTGIMYYPDCPYVKHIQITSDFICETEDSTDLTWLNKILAKYPNLQTIMLLEDWRKSSLYPALVDMAKQNGLAVFEGFQHAVDGDSIICPLISSNFGAYVRGKRVAKQI